MRIYRILLFCTGLILLILFVVLRADSNNFGELKHVKPKKTMTNPNLTPIYKPITQASDLHNTHWILTSLEHKDINPSVYISMYFGDNHIGGFGGCNSFGSEYTAYDSGTISIRGASSTEKGCGKYINKMESKFLQSLGRISFYQVEGNILKFSNETVLLQFTMLPEYVMNPNDLNNTTWKLVSMNGVSLLDGLMISLSFDAINQVKGMSGCIEYELYCQIENDNLGCGNRSTRVCSNLEKKIDSQSLSYTDTFGHWVNYQLSEDYLIINTSRGEGLVFVPM